MAECSFVPGLEANYCKVCRVWVPTEYQIEQLELAVTRSVEHLKEWERFKSKSQKPPKSLMANIKGAREALNKALDVKRDHTRYANKKDSPVVPPQKPTSVQVFKGYQFDKDDDLDLGFSLD